MPRRQASQGAQSEGGRKWRQPDRASRGAGEAPQHLDESLQFGPRSLKRCLGQRRLPYGRLGYRRVAYRRLAYRRLAYRRLADRRLADRRRDWSIQPVRPNFSALRPAAYSAALATVVATALAAVVATLVATVEREGAEGICGERAAAAG